MKKMRMLRKGKKGENLVNQLMALQALSERERETKFYLSFSHASLRFDNLQEISIRQPRASPLIYFFFFQSKASRFQRDETDFLRWNNRGSPVACKLDKKYIISSHGVILFLCWSLLFTFPQPGLIVSLSPAEVCERPEEEFKLEINQNE